MFSNLVDNSGESSLRIDSVFSLSVDNFNNNDIQIIEDGDSSLTDSVCSEDREREENLLRYEKMVFDLKDSDWKSYCNPCFTVLERLSLEDLKVQDSNTTFKCSNYCRKRHLNSLCQFGLLRCDNHPDLNFSLQNETKQTTVDSKVITDCDYSPSKKSYEKDNLTCNQDNISTPPLKKAKLDDNEEEYIINESTGDCVLQDQDNQEEMIEPDSISTPPSKKAKLDDNEEEYIIGESTGDCVLEDQDNEEEIIEHVSMSIKDKEAKQSNTDRVSEIQEDRILSENTMSFKVCYSNIEKITHQPFIRPSNNSSQDCSTVDKLVAQSLITSSPLSLQNQENQDETIDQESLHSTMSSENLTNQSKVINATERNNVSEEKFQKHKPKQVITRGTKSRPQAAKLVYSEEKSVSKFIKSSESYKSNESISTPTVKRKTSFKLSKSIDPPLTYTP